MKQGRIALAITLALLAPQVARAQETRYVVEPATSLAWWQINPNYGHLWATTCPDDPSWQPGEARSFGGQVDKKTRKQTIASGRDDLRIPLYPRTEVKPLCRHAVSGAVLTMDDKNWSSVRGEIVIMPDSLSTGMQMRDNFSTKAVFEAAKYPFIKFRIQRLDNVQVGDTITATAVGTLVLHGVEKPMTAPVKAWYEGENLRAQTAMEFPAHDLVDEYKMSKLSLGMGVTLGRWKTIHMGVDVLLRKS